jgi:hypothetical protein
MTAILIQINEITQRRKYESIREIANAKGWDLLQKSRFIFETRYIAVGFLLNEIPGEIHLVYRKNLAKETSDHKDRVH